MTHSRVNEFDVIKRADASVLRDLANWGDKADEYLRDFFNDEIERVQGTEFGDSIAKLVDLREKALTEPNTFRGVRDKQGRLQAGAIVEPEIDYLSVDNFTSAPWNVLRNQPESLKGAGTLLMEELVKESIDLDFEGRLKLYPIPRAVPFYQRVGFVESEEGTGELELTPLAAKAFLEQQKRFRRTGRR